MSDKRKTTFRVTNIPGSYSYEPLQERLSEALGIGDPRNLQIHSLASDVFCNSRDSTQLVATVTFKDIPLQLQTQNSREVSDGSEPVDEWPILLESTASTTSDRNVYFDTHFTGFTSLSSFEYDSNHSIDCIVIHGWGGHAFGSFKEPKGHYMWLRDSLAKDLPELRVLLYGYKSKVTDENLIAGIEEWTETFYRLLASFWTQSRIKNKPTPLIFLAHSLGGWIFKDAITLMSKSSDSRFLSIIKCTYGALFFGVPSQGMETAALATMIGEGPQRATLNQLEQRRERRWRETKHQEFCKAFNFEDSRVIRFYETFLSPTVQFDHNSQKWLQNGPKMLLVPRESAIYGRVWDRLEDSIPLDGTHSTMVKFKSNDRISYQIVKYQLQETIAVATAVVNGRFMAESVSDEINLPISKEESAALRSLYFSEMRLREDEIQEVSASTCDWLLNHELYSKWLHQGGLLWIEGKPGAGKSTVMQFAVKCARQREARGELRVAAFFIHGQGTALQKTLLGLWQSLLHQILTSNRLLRSKFQSIFETNELSRGRHGKDWKWTVKELQQFFKSIYQQSLTNIPIEVYIDALDECGKEPATELISFLRRSMLEIPQLESHVKICFACRHYPILALKEGYHICVENENSKAIQSYVSSELGQFENLGEITQDILDKSEGVFQWVKLVVNTVSELKENGSNLKRIRRSLDDQPKSLFGIYGQLISTISSEDLPKALLLAQWICFSFRPLSLRECRLLSAFDINFPYSSLNSWKDSEDYIEDDSSMVKQAMLLKGLVEVKKRGGEKNLRFIHQSVRDFFIEEGLRILGISPPESVVAVSHWRLARSCLKFINFEDININIFRSDDIWSNMRTFQEFSLVYYAVRHTFDHFKTAEKEGQATETMIHDNFWIFIALFKKYNYDPKEYERIFHCLFCTFCHYGIFGAAKALLAGAKAVNSQNCCCPFALCSAALEEHEDAVEFLLDNGADIDAPLEPHAPFEEHASALHAVAATPNYSGNDLSILLKRGANVNLVGKDGTALHIASEYDNKIVVQLLLENGADVNFRAGRYGSALQAAASRGSSRILRLLLENGADVNQQGGMFDSALHAALISEFADDVAVSVLIMYGANVNLEGKTYGYPLHAAVRAIPWYRFADMRWRFIMRGIRKVQLLLEAGADVTAAAKEHKNLLHLVLAPDDTPHSLDREVQESIKNLMKLLISKGADLNAKDENGLTVLQHAEIRRFYWLKDFLLEAEEEVKERMKSEANDQSQSQEEQTAIDLNSASMELE